MFSNFESWKEFLGNRLDQAETHGVDDESLMNIAYEVGDYLAKNVEAKNPEEAVLKELWNAASESEQQAIAQTMIKLVQQNN